MIGGTVIGGTVIGGTVIDGTVIDGMVMDGTMMDELSVGYWSEVRCPNNIIPHIPNESEAHASLFCLKINFF